MFKDLLTARSPLSYINLDEIAKKSKFIVRKSKKFSAQGLVNSLMKCIIVGKGSFKDIASMMAKVEKKSISRQGASKRLTESCVDFLSQTAHSIIATQAKPGC